MICQSVTNFVDSPSLASSEPYRSDSGGRSIGKARHFQLMPVRRFGSRRASQSCPEARIALRRRHALISKIVIGRGFGIFGIVIAFQREPSGTRVTSITINGRRKLNESTHGRGAGQQGRRGFKVSVYGRIRRTRSSNKATSSHNRKTGPLERIRPC